MTAESDLHPRRIPGAERAVADERKFTEYLLNPAREPNKARFFAALGFTLDNWFDLRTIILRELPRVPSEMAKPNRAGGYNWGARLLVAGGTGSAFVLTVWSVVEGAPPRLVTAYKARGKRPIH